MRTPPIFRYLVCPYCGQQSYHPDPDTPYQQRAREHIEQCRQHPMRAMETAMRALDPYVKSKYGIPDWVVGQFERALAGLPV